MFVSSLALPLPFLATLIFAVRDRRQGRSFSLRENRFGNRGVFAAAYRQARAGRPCPLETITQHGHARCASPAV